ncbi:putative cytokinetic ring protein SteA [Alkalihalobacillus sp. MEB130]|uniref:putative cytokinetic ring protein SteA n=1 Tax=Alkalihalobacillus sp. MEB130 TaxID=2976704 RepID=UPI0028DEDE8F|nr:putative cytokinetic ring protein SteA [Alkalihalobacillus sp. MEB130]MDT8862541.1 putative cytokinetic ring protein SteA [Alkalihalobacillus sp. MEB130]
MMNLIKGPIYEHEQTKKLLHFLPKRSIVFLWHEDLDGVAVDGLINAQVKAVVNGRASMTGSYPQQHVNTLLQAGIPVFDVISSAKQEKPYQGEEAIIFQDELYVDNKDFEPIFVATLLPYTKGMIEEKTNQAQTNYSAQYDKFVRNTLRYAEKECGWFQQIPDIPLSFAAIDKKEVFIVARNTHYEKDIKAVRHALMRKGTVIVAVDGAADGLLKHKIIPDYIIGDMDSISEQAVYCGAQLICHEHPNGTSPGKERLENMGLIVETIRFVGTSEDVAITATYWSGASRLYLIGCRIGMTEFLEKGRAGMGSTWLCRIQAGDKITDLKGIHQLAHSSIFSIHGQRQNSLKPSLLETIQQLVSERFGGWRKKEVLRHD